MARWFRFYDDAINDPKILKLPEASRWHWTALLCIASKNDGVLPALDDIALMLRVKPAAAAAIIAQMKSAGLLDLQDGKYSPHNWNGRQYKSDVSTDRVKRFRKRERNVSETPPDTEADTEQKEDRIVDARATGSRLTEGSKSLADAFLRSLGIETPLQIPPEMAGTDWRAVEWERAGYSAELVSAEARRVGPGKPLSYYEKCFATAFAKLQAPLPVVEIREAEKLTVTHGSTQNRSGSSLLAALDRRIAEAELAEKPDPALSADTVLRIPNRSIR